MKLIMPAYCDGFRCSADRCSDNCCIGWEIDIDEKTAAFYDGIGGSFGTRLRESIDRGECSSFILKGERCPFLNEKNLCDIIINLGEEHLCQICTDHPRYYEWFGSIKEGGIGLCCEEAAGLILTAENPAELRETDDGEEGEDDEPDEELFSLLYDARSFIFSVLMREQCSIRERVAELLSFSERLQINIDNYNDSLPEDYEVITAAEGDMLSVLKSLTALEPIDEKWTAYLDKSIAGYRKTQIKDGITPYLRNLLIYYIYRYFLKGTFDGEILSKVKLACVSTAVISYLVSREGADLTETVNICKLFSKQTEYSQENIDLLSEMFYEKEFYKSEKIIGLF
ncbi:MAG: hypothetical protein E7543_07065 [Ruminococcaceae bacterium]|nr:hypothetical protein [Oscillospiraceae bacterium]